MSQSFAVVGGGVVGLTTAVQLQKMFPSSAVVNIADKFLENTTSIGAAGMFLPSPTVPKEAPYDVAKMLRDSWKYFDTLVHSKDASVAGSQMLGGYEFYDYEKYKDVNNTPVYAVEKIGVKEMNCYPGPRFLHGYRGMSILTSPARFLPYLMKQYTSNGGRFEKRKLASLEELVGKYDVVVNCSGFGARELVNDSEMYASRGQIIKVNAPWIKTYLYSEDAKGNTTYVLPTTDYVVVGGLRQENDECLQLREVDKNDIWKRATEMVPSLKRAEVVGEWVGLRPMRKTLRLEAEVMKFNTGELNVVHNYGHCGGGISLSWGSSTHAVKLVQRSIQQQQLTSKL